MRQAVKILLVIILLLAIGSIGYSNLMGWGLLDSLYMTMITISTVGFKEIAPLNNAGKLFTILLILVGVGFIAYASSSFFRFIIEGEIRQALGRKKLEKKIEKISNHTIVCGYGRTGQTVCKMLAAENQPFVVIENNSELIERLSDSGCLYIKGDATDEDSLLKAGIKHAGNLVATLSNDPENLYLVVTARQINSNIFIVARGVEAEAEKKLTIAGANKVINPHSVGSSKIAISILRPTVVELIDLGMSQDHIDIQLHEFQVNPKSTLIGLKLSESGLRQKLGVIVIAIKRQGQAMIFNPPSNLAIAAGDILVIIGKKDDLKSMKNMISS